MPDDERLEKPDLDGACKLRECPRCAMPVDKGTIRCPRCYALLVTACSGGCAGCGTMGCTVRRED